MSGKPADSASKCRRRVGADARPNRMEPAAAGEPDRGAMAHLSETSARDFEIFRRGLASIRDFLVLDDLTLIQTG
jgi:hypothetical protein